MRKIGRITVQVLVVLCCVNQPLNMYSQGFFKSLGRELKNTFKDSFNNRTNQNQNGYYDSRARERQEREAAEQLRQEELRKQKEAEELRKQQEAEEAKKLDFYSFAVDASVWMPKNPALSMTEEERTAKYNQMKAANSFKMENGIFKGMHKVMPNLFTLDFHPSSDVPNCGDLTFKALDGTVLTVAWDKGGTTSSERFDKLKTIYNFQGEATLDYLDFRWTFLNDYTTGSIVTPKGDYIKLIRDYYWGGVYIEEAKIMDKEIKGDYIIYKTLFKSHEPIQMSYCPVRIRKTLSDCTIEMADYSEFQWRKVRIYYPNGDKYLGTLYVDIKEEMEWDKMRNTTSSDYYNAAVRMASIIMGADSLADVGTIADGQLFDRQNNYTKIYIKGEYDEIESVAYSQRLQAEENAEKAKAQAAIKQKQKLIQKYGQKYVNLVLKPGVTVGECLVPGMPIGLLKELSDAGKISLEFKKSIVHTNSICYEVYNSRYELIGCVWTDKYKITSVSLN